MVNLLPEEHCDKAQTGGELAVLGVAVAPVNHVAKEVAWRLDRFLRDRPTLEFTDEQVRKAFACALTLCPAAYINVDTLDWNSAPMPSPAVLERSVSEAVRKVSALNPKRLRASEPHQRRI